MARKTDRDRAVAEVSKIMEALLRWESEVAAAGAELADLEGRVGAEVLDDETALDRLTVQMSALRSTMDVGGRAVVEARGRLVEAHRAVLRARAGELRVEAADLTAQADARQQKTDRLLDELATWEGGCRYVPFDLPAGVDISHTHPPVKVPITQQIRNRARALEHEATALDAKANEQHPDRVRESVAPLLKPAA